MAVVAKNTLLKQGYKQSEAGVIPDDWQTRPLGGIGELTSSKRIYESEYVEVGIPFYRGKEVSLLINGESLDDEYFISERRYNQIQRDFGVPNAGDILITAVGTLGNIYVVPDNSKFYFKDGNLIWLRGIRGADPNYIAAQLVSKRSEILANSIGSSQRALTIVALKAIPIPVPPFGEQRAIAAALSDADALLRSLDRLITKKCDVKIATMQQLLTGKTRLPGFSGEWVKKKLGEIGTFSKGKGLSKNELNDSGSLPAIPYTAIYTDFNEVINRSRISMFVDSPLNTIVIKGPHLLIASSSNMLENIGKTTAYIDNADVAVGGDIVLYKTAHNVCFLSYLLNTIPHRKRIVFLSQGSTIRHVYASTFVTYELFLPPLDEQNAIAAVLADIDSEIAALEQRRNKTLTLKQGMMQELLTGRRRLV